MVINMENELVSVVIPTHNREDMIKRAIDSVLNQTYSNLEVIVVDDASTDNTEEIVNGYHDSRVRLICQKVRGGANKARNIGIKNSKGGYIAFQDSDDEWLPNKLECQMGLMETSKRQVCYCAYYHLAGEKRTIMPADYENSARYQNNLQTILKAGNVASTQTLVIKKDVLDLLQEPFFDENMPRLQDYDIVIRLIQICDFAYVNRPLVNVYASEQSITMDSKAMYDAAVRIIEKHSSFLDIYQFIGTVIESNILDDNPDQLIAGLNKIQENVNRSDIDCKDLMLKRMSGIIKFQNVLLLEQYTAAVENLTDGSFMIYGAGEIGQEVYRSLKKRGLKPSCFLVTKCKGTEYIDNIPVVSVDDCKNRSEMVIVGVSEKYQTELAKNLRERKYKHFCIYKRM